MKLSFVVGSLSAVKKSALLRAFEREGLADFVTIHGVDAKSGVALQPVGEEEIRAGALNRAMAAHAQSPDSFAVGMENGVVYERHVNPERQWSDKAGIALIWPDGRVQVGWSNRCYLPTKMVERAFVEGVNDVTVGQVIARDNPGAVASDPHTFVTEGRMSREDQLAGALFCLLQDRGIFDYVRRFAAAQTRGKHLIHVNGVERELPIVAVPKLGCSLAVMDVLGDRELNQAMGERLAEEIRRAYPDAEALFMPDGKANALLHVVGTSLKLPTYVARKVVREVYAGPDCVVHQYGKETATSQGSSQQLVLSRKHADELRGKKTVILDDVISTGASIEASEELLKIVGATVVGKACGFVEGAARSDVISLGLLPLYPL